MPHRTTPSSLLLDEYILRSVHVELINVCVFMYRALSSSSQNCCHLSRIFAAVAHILSWSTFQSPTSVLVSVVSMWLSCSPCEYSFADTGAPIIPFSSTSNFTGTGAWIALIWVGTIHWAKSGIMHFFTSLSIVCLSGESVFPLRASLDESLSEEGEKTRIKRFKWRTSLSAFTPC